MTEEGERLYEKASGAVLSQPSQHDADHSDVDPGFFTAREQFIVLGEPTPRREPGKRSFYYPTPFEDMKASGTDLLPIHFGPFWDPDASSAAPRMLDDLHLPPEPLLHPIHEIALLVGASGSLAFCDGNVRN